MFDNLFPDWSSKRASQCRAILYALCVGPKTSVQLARLALKYTSRISDLRKTGYTVLKSKLPGKPIYLYTLGKQG